MFKMNRQCGSNDFNLEEANINYVPKLIKLLCFIPVKNVGKSHEKCSCKKLEACTFLQPNLNYKNKIKCNFKNGGRNRKI